MADQGDQASMDDVVDADTKVNGVPLAPKAHRGHLDHADRKESRVNADTEVVVAAMDVQVPPVPMESEDHKVRTARRVPEEGQVQQVAQEEKDIAVNEVPRVSEETPDPMVLQASMDQKANKVQLVLTALLVREESEVPKVPRETQASTVSRAAVGLQDSVAGKAHRDHRVRLAQRVLAAREDLQDHAVKKDSGESAGRLVRLVDVVHVDLVDQINGKRATAETSLAEKSLADQ